MQHCLKAFILLTVRDGNFLFIYSGCTCNRDTDTGKKRKIRMFKDVLYIVVQRNPLMKCMVCNHVTGCRGTYLLLLPDPFIRSLV